MRASKRNTAGGSVAEEPTNYDLVINTDGLTADEAADLIAQAARA